MTSTAKEQFIINLSDMQGKIILERIIDLEMGNNLFTFELNDLKKGNYILNISNDLEIVNSYLINKK